MVRIYLMVIDGTKLIHDEVRDKCKLEFHCNGERIRVKISTKSMRLLLRDLPFEVLA